MDRALVRAVVLASGERVAADAFVNAAGAWEKKWGLRLNRLNAPPHYVGEQPPNTTLTDKFAKGSVAHLLAT